MVGRRHVGVGIRVVVLHGVALGASLVGRRVAGWTCRPRRRLPAVVGLQQQAGALQDALCHLMLIAERGSRRGFDDEGGDLSLSAAPARTSPARPASASSLATTSLSRIPRRAAVHPRPAFGPRESATRAASRMSAARKSRSTEASFASALAGSSPSNRDSLTWFSTPAPWPWPRLAGRRWPRVPRRDGPVLADVSLFFRQRATTASSGPNPSASACASSRFGTPSGTANTTPHRRRGRGRCSCPPSGEAAPTPFSSRLSSWVHDVPRHQS